MKCHTKIHPRTPALPVQKPHAPLAKWTLKSSQDTSLGRPGQNVSMERTPATFIAQEPDGAGLIYVVDDEPRLVDLYTIILEAQGYLVKAFHNRVEALAELKGAIKKPDLLIMDYLGHAMPIDRFMQGCLQAHPNLRILVASGFNQMDARFPSVRPDRYLQKPFTAEEFLSEVKIALLA